MESYVQFDQCVPQAVIRNEKFEVFSSSLRPLVENDLVLTYIDNAPVGIKQIYGCEFPKLRVVSNVSVQPSDQEALLLMKNTDDFSNLLVLSREYSQEKTSVNNPIPEAGIRVVSFSPNQLQLNIEVNQENAWLVYSDSYHPDWRATVNGE